MIFERNPKASLKHRYTLVLRIGLVITLLLCIIVLMGFPKFKSSIKIEKEYKMAVEMIDVPQTQQQFEQPPPPSRPSIPIESENEDLSEDITIEETSDITQYEAWDAPPPPPSEDDEPDIRFIAYDKPPEPIGGFAAIQRKVIYPEIALEAGIEGKIIVRAFVNEFGVVKDCLILSGIEGSGLNEAAIDAVKKSRFYPAQQRDRNVAVWITVPVIFKLASD